jgi:hypothetical protein
MEFKDYRDDLNFLYNEEKKPLTNSDYIDNQESSIEVGQHQTKLMGSNIK